MNNKNITNVQNVTINDKSMNKFIDMNSGQIKGLGDGNEDGRQSMSNN